MAIEMATTMEGGSLRLMKECALLVEDEAKRMVGDDASYELDISPLPSWKKLAESTLADKTQMGFSPPDRPLERYGDLKRSIQHVATPKEAVVGTDDPVALLQEAGTTGAHPIPPRSFLGGAAVRKGPEIQRKIGMGVESILRSRRW